MAHRTRIPAWAVKRGQRLNNFPTIDPARTALLVVDLQQGYLAGSRPFVTDFSLPIVPKVNRIAASLRQCGGLVVFLRQTFSSDPTDIPAWKREGSEALMAFRAGLQVGAPTHEVYEGLEVEAADLVIDKYRHSGFTPGSSPLEAELKARQIDTVIVTGAMTNVCCEATARDANALGYRVLVVSDATASITNAEHNAALLNLRLAFADVRKSAEIIRMISAGMPA